MSDATFMGLFIGALATIIPLFVACVTPIIKLNKSIQKLNDSIDALNNADSKKQELLTSIDNRLNRHQSYLVVDKKRLDNMSRRLHKIDNEEGFIDNENRE